MSLRLELSSDCLMQTQIRPTTEQLLVIDDDAELCKLVTRYLTREGFQIESVNGGASGAELALSGKYALVVLDVMMPGVNGFDVLEVLVRAADQVVGREILTRDVLGREFSPFDRSIDTPVCNLRKKIGLLTDGTERIKGVRGIGYLYAVPSH